MTIREMRVIFTWTRPIAVRGAMSGEAWKVRGDEIVPARPARSIYQFIPLML